MDIDPPYINYLLGSGDWYITLLKLWFGLGLGFLLSLGWFWGWRWVFMMSLQMLIFGWGRECLFCLMPVFSLSVAEESLFHVLERPVEQGIPTNECSIMYDYGGKAIVSQRAIVPRL